VVVRDDVGVTKGAKDIKLGGELFAFLLRHLDVVDFLATKDLDRKTHQLPTRTQRLPRNTHESISLALDLADDSEGTTT
jgi:hypothetical protein